MILIIFQIIILFLFSLFILIYSKQIYQRDVVCKNIPGPPIVPLFGNAFQIGHNPRRIVPNMIKIMEDYGKIVQIWLGPLQLILISDLRVAEKILNSMKHIKKPEALYRYTRPFVGNGLAVNNQVESWHKKRKVLTPAFHFTILEQSIPTFSSLIDHLLNKIEEHVNGPAFDIFPYLERYTLDVICESAMGVKMNVQTNAFSSYLNAVHTMLEIITDRIYSVISQFDFVFNHFLQNGKKQKECLKVINGMVDDVIIKKQLLKQNQDTPEKHNAFLDTILNCTIDGKPLTNKEIRDEVNVFMFAGYETSSRTAAFLFYELANHPEIQRKLFEEINEVLGKEENKSFIISDLNKLKYLDAVIKETLRLYPPAMMYPRSLGEDLEIDDIKIPGNRDVSVFAYAIHHNEDNYSNAENFEPERFVGENSYGRNPYMFIPFSAGPRNCIGQKYGLVLLKFLTVAMLQNYELLSAGAEHKIQLGLSSVLLSMNGVFIRVKRRLYE